MRGPWIADSRNAYGPDNCDLETIANIVDTNIVPNVRDAFGLESDVNEDDKISIVITPVLNYMTQFSDDEDSAGTLVGSYADPEVDLTEFDVQDNLMSDEQEVIYVHALDPWVPECLRARDHRGLHRPRPRRDRARLHPTRLLQQGAVGNRVGRSRRAWLQEGLAALAADITGSVR